MSAPELRRGRPPAFFASHQEVKDLAKRTRERVIRPSLEMLQTEIAYQGADQDALAAKVGDHERRIVEAEDVLKRLELLSERIHELLVAKAVPE